MPRNLTEALTTSLKALLSEGYTVPSRNGATKELYAHQVKIERPQERVIMTPARGANIFAQLAEAMWVMGGRDDMAFLSKYLPRAPDYSDDGEVWRAGYGTRLRAWPLGDNPPVHSTTNPSPDTHVDQIEECLKILCESLDSRRAVAVIFDPARDYCQSKDIPCNNWLHFLVRDGKLNVTVSVRSNDAIWGFSGINMFEWSVLQQFMAHWLGVEVGTMAYTASSFHLYDYHFDKASNIVTFAKSKTLYDFGFEPPAFSTGWEDFGPAMDEFFEIEEMFWQGTSEDIKARINGVSDDFLRVTLQMLQVYVAYLQEVEIQPLTELVNEIPECDLRMGSIDFLTRQKMVREKGFIDATNLSEREQEYLTWYRKKAVADVSVEDIFTTLKLLHWKKTQSYGDSWKKHGEILGLFSNITRKRDRILSLQGGAVGTADEGIFDTISDLCVYAGKYLTLIAELYPVEFGDFLQDAEAQQVWPTDIDEYAHTMGFEPVLDMLAERAGRGDERIGKVDWNTLDDCITWVETEYRKLEDLLTDKYQPRSGNRPNHGKIATEAAARMCLLCAQALRVLSRQNPGTWESYVDTVEKL
jgi:thymidylate synthase